MLHTCHAIGCNRQVPAQAIMCRPHWFMVPKPLREEISLTYRPGHEIDKEPSAEYLDAARRAKQAVAEKEAGKNASGEVQRSLFGG